MMQNLSKHAYSLIGVTKVMAHAVLGVPQPNGE